MREITVWYRKDKDGIFVHNHIEDGHVKELKPIPKYITQNSWINEEWEKHFGFLDDNDCVIITD